VVKRIKRRAQDQRLPSKFLKSLDPEEFKFGLDLWIAAASQKMPMDNPADHSVTIEGFGTVRFTDNPMNRATLAIAGHYKSMNLSDEERFARSASFNFRIEALKKVIQHRRAAPWIREDEALIHIPDAVLCAAARGELRAVKDEVEFEPQGFWDFVEQIAAEQ
jgi:hypothetical protein